jgi:dephospho-CoA kinase
VPPFVAGLTGGIGSGKSTVSALLAERGAVVIDADRISRALTAPGGGLFDKYVELFGADIVATDGTLDRAKIASIVFSDPEKLKALNAVAWPAIGVEMARQRAEQDELDNIVVLDIPLLAEGQATREERGLAAVIVVDTPEDEQVRRLVTERGMAETDVRARIAAQAERDKRLALADFVVDNTGTLEHLTTEVDRCWAWLQEQRAASRA